MLRGYDELASILPEGEGYETVRDWGLDKHHIFGGANRKHSEKYRLYVYIPHEQHVTGCGHMPDAVFNERLEQAAQRAFEQHYPEECFFRIFGFNCLPEREYDHDELFGIGVVL